VAAIYEPRAGEPAVIVDTYARSPARSRGRAVPTLARAGPYRIFMFMSDCVEPRHVDIEGNDGAAKFWLEPVYLATSMGYSPRQINRLRLVVERDRSTLIQAFDDVCRRIES
jgi:hypothetical protein